MPELSTAAQKLAEGQETERWVLFGSMRSGFDQLVPFQVKALLYPFTATQKLAEGQETETRKPSDRSMAAGGLQVRFPVVTAPAEAT